MEVIATIKLDSNFSSTFHKNVVAEIAEKIKKESVKIKSTITDKLRNTVRDSLMATEEYQSIVHGKLRAELRVSWYLKIREHGKYLLNFLVLM